MHLKALREVNFDDGRLRHQEEERDILRVSIWGLERLAVKHIYRYLWRSSGGSLRLSSWSYWRWHSASQGPPAPRSPLRWGGPEGGPMGAPVRYTVPVPRLHNCCSVWSWRCQLPEEPQAVAERTAGRSWQHGGGFGGQCSKVPHLLHLQGHGDHDHQCGGGCRELLLPRHVDFSCLDSGWRSDYVGNSLENGWHLTPLTTLPAVEHSDHRPESAVQYLDVFLCA